MDHAVIARIRSRQGHRRGYANTLSDGALGKGSRRVIRQSHGFPCHHAADIQGGSRNHGTGGAIIGLGGRRGSCHVQRLGRDRAGQGGLRQGVVGDVCPRDCITTDRHRLAGSCTLVVKQARNRAGIQIHILAAHHPDQASPANCGCPSSVINPTRHRRTTDRKRLFGDITGQARLTDRIVVLIRTQQHETGGDRDSRSRIVCGKRTGVDVAQRHRVAGNHPLQCRSSQRCRGRTVIGLSGRGPGHRQRLGCDVCRQASRLGEAVIPRLGSRQGHRRGHTDARANLPLGKGPHRPSGQSHLPGIPRLRPGQRGPRNRGHRGPIILLVGRHRPSHRQALRRDRQVVRHKRDRVVAPGRDPTLADRIRAHIVSGRTIQRTAEAVGTHQIPAGQLIGQHWIGLTVDLCLRIRRQG